MLLQKRTETAQQVAELLATARRALGLSLAFLSRMDGTTQHLEVVESSLPMVFRDGMSRPQATTLCQAIRDGKLPPVMPDLREFPEAMALPAAKVPRLRSFVSVPVVLSDGTVYGTLCAAGFKADRELAERDKALMDVLAHAASVILEPSILRNAHQLAVENRLAPMFAAGGPRVVLQPIVELATGHRVGAEALSRFPADWGLAPDVCFDDAHSIGRGEELELLAVERAGEHLERVGGYIAMNLSPLTVTNPQARKLMQRLPLHRVLLELSEHQPVDDYDSLRAVLDPLRADGLRLAIDDVGAGFSSLRHIVLTSPDVIKLDRFLVDGVAHDPVLRKLVHALVDFGHGCDARVVAEGIETAEDAEALRALGVDYGQGWLFGRPGPPESLAEVADQAAAQAA